MSLWDLTASGRQPPLDRRGPSAVSTSIFLIVRVRILISLHFVVNLLHFRANLYHPLRQRSERISGGLCWTWACVKEAVPQRGTAAVDPQVKAGHITVVEPIGEV